MRRPTQGYRIPRDAGQVRATSAGSIAPNSAVQARSNSPLLSQLGTSTKSVQGKQSTFGDGKQPHKEPTVTEQPYPSPPWVYQLAAIEWEFSGQSRGTGVSQIESNVRGAVSLTDNVSFHDPTMPREIHGAGRHLENTAKSSRRPPNTCESTGSGDSPVNGLPGRDVVDFDDPSSYVRCFVRSPSPKQRCQIHRLHSSAGRCANDDFVRCAPLCPFFDPDATEPDRDTYQVEFDETGSDETGSNDEGVEVRAAAAIALLGIRRSNGNQALREHTDEGEVDAEVKAAAKALFGIRSSNESQVLPEHMDINRIDRVQNPPTNGETRPAEVQEALARVGRTLESDLGPRWAPPTSCGRPRKKPKRFEN